MRPNVQAWTRPRPMMTANVKVDLGTDPNGPALLLSPAHAEWFIERLRELNHFEGGNRP